MEDGQSKCNLEFMYFLLFLSCWAQLSHLSNVRLKYLIAVIVRIKLLFSETEEQFLGLNVNVIKDDLESFNFIFHRLDHSWIILDGFVTFWILLGGCVLWPE